VIERPRREYRFSAAVYGSILVAALVGATFEAHVSARTMTLSLLGSVVIFWIAHAWSEVLGERVEEGRMFDRARIATITVEEWPLVEAGILPAALLAFAWAGIYSRDVGAVLAMSVAILQLVGWGMLAGHRTQPTWRRALVVGVVDGLLGIAIVAIEIAVHR
jgi:hypothetical protein